MSTPSSRTGTRNGGGVGKAADAMVGVELGETGLKQQGGIVREEWNRKLQGDKAIRVYAEMRDNSQVAGAVLHAIEMYLRRVTWTTRPYSDDNEDLRRAEFADSLRDDMSHTWPDFISEAVTMLPFGHAFHESVLKVRQGQIPDSPGESSKHADGLIGWRKLPLRGQESKERWLFDESGGIQGMVQRLTEGGTVTIPIEKALLFRTTTAKGNPEGRSVFRTAYRAYHYAKRTEEYEAVGTERDLAGIPMAEVPEALLDPNASEQLRASRLAIEDILKNVRNDEQAGIMWPLAYDAKGNQRYRFSLLASPGTKQVKTGEIIDRWHRYEAMSLLADVILLGHEKVGSEALARTKSEMFTLSLDTWMQHLADVVNLHGLPRIFRLNGFPTDRMPTYVPAPVTEVDLMELVQMVAVLSGQGAAFFPNPELEQWIAGKIGIPADLLDVTRGAPV